MTNKNLNNMNIQKLIIAALTATVLPTSLSAQQTFNEMMYSKEKIRHHMQLCDTATHKVFYDKLEYIYVEIAKFNKTLGELDTLY